MPQKAFNILFLLSLAMFSWLIGKQVFAYLKSYLPKFSHGIITTLTSFILITLSLIFSFLIIALYRWLNHR